MSAKVQDLGKVSVTVAGEWSSVQPYTRLDIVSYQGSSYIAIKDVPSGIVLLDPSYWLCIAEKGEKGEKGDTGETGATGNGIASVEKTGTSGNVDTYTITYTDGSTTTFTVTNGAVTSVDGKTGDVSLSNKADIDGYYGGMGVGIADNLNANEKIHLTKPYVLRSTAESEDVAGLYKRTHLTGGSLVWNQLMPNDNVKTLTNYTSGSGNVISTTEVTKAGHIYALFDVVTEFEYPSEDGALFYRLYYDGVAHSQGSPLKAVIFKATNDGANVCYINFATNYRNRLITKMSFNPKAIDLTTTFGTTFANAIYSMNDHGVAWLYANFPELNGGYIPYSAPHFEHSKYKGVTSNGVNQFNGQTAEGFYNSTTGAFVSRDTYICSDDLFVCLPNTTYYLKFKANASLYIMFYDINKNYIPPYSAELGNTTFTTPSNAYYMAWWQSKANYGSQTYQNDVGFYIHYDTTYDDIHEDYESWYTDLGSDVLKGIPVADDYTGSNVWSGKWHWEGDTKTPDGTITENYALVDLGTLTWEKLTTTGTGYWFRAVLPVKGVSAGTALANILCSKYRNISPNDAYTNTLVGIAVGITTISEGYIFISDTSFADATTLKASLSGVYLLYEVITPTTSQGTAYEENEQCHNWGIQYVEDAEYDDGNRAFKMPMGGEEVYTPNITEKVEAMPSAPVSDGDYIVRVVNHKAEYIPLPNSFPTVPTTTDGRYDLVADVANGTVTLSWVLRS